MNTTPNITPHVAITDGPYKGKFGRLEYQGTRISFVRFSDAKNYEIQGDFINNEFIAPVTQEGGEQ